MRVRVLLRAVLYTGRGRSEATRLSSHGCLLLLPTWLLWRKSIASGWETCWPICVSLYVKRASLGAMAGSHMTLCFGAIRKASPPHGMCWMRPLSLHQVYIANQGVKVATPCKHCHEVDHVAADCAITAVLPQVTNTTSSVANTVPPTSTPERGSSKGKRSLPYTRQRPICTSWNGGKLQVPGQVHVCSCVCQLLWQPSSLSLSRKALLQCSHSREAGHPSSKGTMTG